MKYLVSSWMIASMVLLGIIMVPGMLVAEEVIVGSNGQIIEVDDSNESALIPARQRSGDGLVFEPEFHFGEVWEGELVRHRFTITNRNPEPVELVSVIPTCGCTATIVSRNRIAQGESSHIDVTFNTLNRAGDMEKSIIVRTNLSDPSTIRFYLKGLVKPIVSVEPRFVPLGVIHENEDASFTIEIQLHEERTDHFAITDVESVSDFVTFETENLREVWKIHVTIDTDALRDRSQAELEELQSLDQTATAIPYIFQGIIRIHTNLDAPGKQVLYVRFNGQLG